jgi:maleate isomerase
MTETPSPLVLDLSQMPYRADSGTGARARIGAIVLATDHTMEAEWREMLALDGVAFYVARIWNDAKITPETLAALGAEIAPATRLILPNDPRLDAVAFACTSGAMVLGEDFVAREVHRHRPGIPVTSPMRAGIEALRALGVRRAALLTPYMQAINDRMRAHVEAHGIAVPAIELGRAPEVDGVFISCSSFRAAGIVAPLEQAIGKPATASNHAMAWHALRLAGYRDPVPGWGSLFAL